MRQRDRLIVNSLLNVLARVFTVATRFVIVPLAVGVLGRRQYGLWVIVGQIFAFTRMLDMGLRSAVAKHVAGGLATGDYEGLNRQVNTAAGYYTAGGLAIVVATCIVCCIFPDCFHVAPEYHTAVRVTVLVSGLTLALGFPQNAYGAVVTGLQRYDVIAGSNILEDLLRLLLIVLFLEQIGPGNGLILLAIASGGTYLLGATARTLAALRLCRHVRFQPWRVDRSRLRELLAFGLNSVVYMTSIQVGMQLAQIVVGALMGADEAADLNVAGTFILAAHAFVVAFGISARVAASRYDGERNDAMLRHLLIRSTRYSAFLTFAGMTALWLYADVLFQLWIGRQYAGPGGEDSLASVVGACRTLIPGYGLFWLSLPAYNVINGMGRHRLPAVAALVAGIMSVVFVVGIAAATPGASIERIAWGIVLPMFPIWGVIIPWYCCRQTQQPIGSYVREGMAGPFLAVLPAGIIGFLWNHHAIADSWAALTFRALVLGLVLLAVGWVFVLRRDDRTSMMAGLKNLHSTIFRR